MIPTLNNDALPITGAINDILIKYTSLLAEVERLQSEVGRLQSENEKAAGLFRDMGCAMHRKGDTQ